MHRLVFGINFQIHSVSLTILVSIHLHLSIDPSAAPPPLFRLARTKSGWRAGAPTKIRLAAAGDFFRRRRNSARPRERRHITLLVSLSMEHVVSTASVVTVGYFGAH